MKIESMKLAQALPGTTSNVLNCKSGTREITYDMVLNPKGYFEITQTNGKDEGRKFIIFSANCVYAIPAEESKTK